MSRRRTIEAGPKKALSWTDRWSAAQRTSSLPQLIADLHAAADHDPTAMAYLAMLYREGVEVPNGKPVLARNAARSLAFARRGAAAGNEDALLEVADRLADSRKPAEAREGLRIYLRLARGNNMTAMHNLAVTYRQRGEIAKAVRWLRRVAARGDASAKFELAKAKYFGRGMRRQPAQALTELLALASKERIDLSPYEREECLVFVARALLDGWNVPIDFARACSHLRTAASLGSATAAAFLDELGG